METYDVLIFGYDDKGNVVCQKRLFPTVLPDLGQLAKHMPTNAVRMKVDIALPATRKEQDVRPC